MKLRKLSITLIVVCFTFTSVTVASPTSKTKPPVTDSETQSGSWIDQFLNYFSF